MKFDKAKIAISFILVATVFGILTLLFWDFIRDTIGVPIYHLIWLGGLILKSIPQEAYWGFLIFISVLIGFNALGHIRTQQFTGNAIENRSQSSARYLRWRTLCANLYSSPFSREQFAWEARTLALSILAYEQGIDTSEVEARIKDAHLVVPDAIRHLIEQRDIRSSPQTPSRFKDTILRLRQLLFKSEPPNDPQIDNQVTEIIRFLADHLE